MKKSATFFTLLAFLLLCGSAAAQVHSEYSEGTWVVHSRDAQTETFRGRTALRMRVGTAYRSDVKLEDGTIEFDIALTTYRSFVGVTFRMQSEKEEESIYFRPHKSGHWDAIQYDPVFDGATTWQLYPDYNATAELPTDRWLHVKLTVAGRRAALYLDGASQPTMVLPLQRTPQSGYVGFRSDVVRGFPEGIRPGNFANLVVKPGPVEVPAPPPGAAETDPGVLKDWRLSTAFPRAEATPEHVASSEFQKALEWQTVTCDTNGVVNLTRTLGSAEKDRSAALAKVELWSERAQVKKLGFGYSDDVTIFLNGQPLYSGVNGYSSRYPLYLGGVTPKYDAVYLPLREGKNELLFLVSERWGGWGFAARLDDREGVEVK